MKKLQQSTILVIDKHQQKTSTLHINSWLLRHLRPALLGLSAISVLMAAGLIGVGIKYYQAGQDNEQLRTQVEYLNDYTSAETAAKINSLKKTESTINALEGYLQERGANHPPPKAKVEDTTEKLSVGGEFHPISASSAFSATYNQNLEKLLAEIRSIPIGVPHSGQLNSRFGRRANPFGGHSGENHPGLDFKGATGEPIQATADGEVVQAGYAGGYGNAVKIKHGFNYETLYAHMSEIGVAIGQKIQAGDVIGKVGSTGRSTGPHLHYEVRLNGTPIDPENFLTLKK